MSSISLSAGSGTKEEEEDDDMVWVAEKAWEA
jgi:hypothetical protein